MARIKVEVGGRLRALQDRARDPAPLLNLVGLYLVGATQRRFETQRFGGQPWPPRRVPNVAGIVRDLAAGGAVKGRRFEARPALIDTGRLRGSIASRPVGKNVVEVGTTVAYAALHQRGGTSEPIKGAARSGGDPALRSALGRYLHGADAAVRGRLAWLYGTRSFTIRVPARPFLGADRADEEKIAALSRAYLEGKGASGGGA